MIHEFKILSRTNKTVEVENLGRISRKRVSIDSAGEYIKPYSYMAYRKLYATRTLEEVKASHLRLRATVAERIRAQKAAA